MRDLHWLLFWRTSSREERESFIFTLHEIHLLPEVSDARE